ncbi:MAG TPA: hypothetical protein VFE31_11235 [Opitutaceae bacterium]|jgi:hypothetical protein|nr:hypothetical protein [Opitutaceae bacterium]
MSARTLLAAARVIACVSACDIDTHAEAAAPSAHDELTSLIEQDARIQWASRREPAMPLAAPSGGDVVQMAPFYVHAPLVRVTRTQYETPLMRLIRTGILWKKSAANTTSVINMSFSPTQSGQARSELGYVIQW